MTTDPRPELLDQIDALIARYVSLRERDGEGPDGPIRLSSVPFDQREVSLALRTILSNWISQGPRVREFEASFAEYVGVKHAVAVNSGSSANLLALTALIEDGRLRPGDEVVVPATTFATVASPVIQVGCIPVYVDIDVETYNIRPDAIAPTLGPRTRAVMVVHTLGYPADMASIAGALGDEAVIVIEDCCEAHGSAIDGRRVGTFGELATCSFFVAHNMTTGEGGMILTNNERYASLSRSLREFGRVEQVAVGPDRIYTDPVLGEYDPRYVFERLGYNVRMTDIAASFGIEQLRKLDDMNARRIENAAYLTDRLRVHDAYLRLPAVRPGYTHTYYTYPIAVRPESGLARRDLVRFLEQRGIETRPIFAGCLPDQPGFHRAPHRIGGDLAGARSVKENAFFVGIHPGLRGSHLARLADSFDAFFERAPQRSVTGGKPAPA